MRISAPITVSALVVAGLVATGSTTNTTDETKAPQAPEALLAASSQSGGSSNIADNTAETQLSRTVGLLAVTPDAPRKLTALTPPADGAAPFAGAVPLRDIALPATGGALGIPEIVLAAYRNAELAMASQAPNCGLTWNLLAGIGRIESAHASNGRTDAAGTSVTPIFGPALDGTLPGNEVIKATDGGYVRALGPMQFLPSTWSHYAADGNGDGVADPHNVFDATVAAGKYLCSGGLNLRDPAQELRAVLRYNNSMSYAANVLSWSAAYRTGGTPAQVSISPDLIPPGQAPIQAGPDMLAVNTVTPTTPGAAGQLPPNTSTTVAPATPTTPAQVMINIPGLPPIPCGIFCPPPPPPANPCAVQTVPAPMPRPGDPALPPAAATQNFGADNPKPEAANQPAPVCAPPAVTEQQVPAPRSVEAPPQQQAEQPEVATTQPPEPPAAEPAPPVAPPAITLPFNIVIPLPPAPVG
ncbi:lytic transglycosylase domain-containing protein [Nocardia bovistercoris]|uniref:Lytic murein transglycosylase n=1 Tax=Nocardia bovistercoris TaxID=2785916 RepID=A0A931I8V8_9NOCA|nr:lytic murein transglycosylase [Nocardia bovistercoris]MBH0775877.1 lytic murein transglycosylase [Nocardia bovistercoris]